MELKDLLSAAFDSGLGSHHDCKTSKQFEDDKTDFFDNYEDEIEALNMRIVSHRRELLINLLASLEVEGGNKFVDKEWIVDNYLSKINL